MSLVVSFFAYSLAVAGLSLFLQACQRPGMIFGGYALWCRVRLLNAGVLTVRRGRVARMRPIRNGRWERLRRWLYKPLGGCVYCFGTWLTIGLFVPATRLFVPAGPVPWVLLPLCVGLFFLFLRLAERILD